MVNAMGRRTRVPVEPPAQFKNEKPDDMRIWLLRGTDPLGKTIGSRKTSRNQSDML